MDCGHGVLDAESGTVLHKRSKRTSTVRRKATTVGTKDGTVPGLLQDRSENKYRTDSASTQNTQWLQD